MFTDLICRHTNTYEVLAPCNTGMCSTVNCEAVDAAVWSLSSAWLSSLLAGSIQNWVPVTFTLDDCSKVINDLSDICHHWIISCCALILFDNNEEWRQFSWNTVQRVVERRLWKIQPLRKSMDYKQASELSGCCSVPAGGIVHECLCWPHWGKWWRFPEFWHHQMTAPQALDQCSSRWAPDPSSESSGTQHSHTVSKSLELAFHHTVDTYSSAVLIFYNDCGPYKYLSYVVQAIQPSLTGQILKTPDDFYVFLTFCLTLITHTLLNDNIVSLNTYHPSVSSDAWMTSCTFL